MPRSLKATAGEPTLPYIGASLSQGLYSPAQLAFGPDMLFCQNIFIAGSISKHCITNKSIFAKQHERKQEAARVSVQVQGRRQCSYYSLTLRVAEATQDQRRSHLSCKHDIRSRNQGKIHWTFCRTATVGFVTCYYIEYCPANLQFE